MNDDLVPHPYQEMDRDLETLTEGFYQRYLNDARVNPEEYYNPFQKKMLKVNPYKTAAKRALIERIRDENAGKMFNEPLRNAEHGLVAQYVGMAPSAVMTPTYSLLKYIKNYLGLNSPGDTPPSMDELRWGLRPWWGKD